jgi:hypothetical protein
MGCEPKIKMKMEKFEEKIFWKDGFDGEALSGIMFRSFDLNKFIKKVEIDNGHEVVGIKFEDNNLELIVKK